MVFDALIARLGLLTRLRLYGPALLIAAVCYVLLARVPLFRSLPLGVSRAARIALGLVIGLIGRIAMMLYLGY